MKSIFIGLGLAGLALWLGNRAGNGIKDQLGIGEAHTPDGTDTSRSFNAGIADENSIPDFVPAS